MRKKTNLFFLIVAMGMSAAMATACADQSNNGKNDNSTSSPEKEVEKVYEGDMLYNGFDSVADMYRVSQLFDWNYTPMGKLSVVNKDNFIPVVSEEGVEEAAAAVVAKIAALPEVEAVTLADKDAVNLARKAYGSLSNKGKKLVTNIDKLKQLENTEVLSSNFTITEFGGDFTTDIVAPDGGWTGYSGDLVNKKSGTVVFNASNIAKIDGALYISLFHDGSVNKGQAGDGVCMWVRTHNNTVLLQNAGDQAIAFNEGKSIQADKTYTFTISYNVEDDYSKLTIGVKIVDEDGDVICEGTKEVTNFSLSDFGPQTVQSWLSEHENKDNHQTFYINAGNSGGVKLMGAWAGTKQSDFDEPAEDPHTQDDLAPRQGDGALRVYYERGSFTNILARFDKSELEGMPVKELGGCSIKVYNDSAKAKTVTLSLMKDKNQKLEIADSTFTLNPYEWTECKVTFDPVVIDSLADQLIGLNVAFSDTTDSVYYVDDFRVQFGKIYTDEIRELLGKVNFLKEEIGKLDGKVIEKTDKETINDLYTKYIDLPQAYRFTVTNYDILKTAIKDYLALEFAEEPDTAKTTLYFDEILGLTQVNEYSGVTYSYDTENHLENQNGALKLDFNGTVDWIAVGLTPIAANGYDEVHVWVNNDSEEKRAIFLNWLSADQAIGESVSGDNILAGYVVPANSGWIELIYKKQFTLSEIDTVSVNASNAPIKSVGTLYVGKVVMVSLAGEVSETINNLPEYAAGYSDENKAAVVAARNAYNALCLDSRDKVDANAFNKLISLEAAIWREGFALLPETPAGIEAYSDAYKDAIDNLRKSYNALDRAVKQAVANDEAILTEFETKIAEYRIDYVMGLINKLQVKTSYKVNDIVAIKTAKAEFDKLSDAEKENIGAEKAKLLSDCIAGIATYYTIADLGDISYMAGASEDEDGSTIGSWGYSAWNLADGKEGTIVFKAKGIKANTDGAMYITLFHDASKNAGQAGDGAVAWVRTNNNTFLFQNAGDKTLPFESGKTFATDKTYVFYINYVISDDYSSVKISITVEEENGDVIASGSVEITNFSPTDFGAQTVAGWLNSDDAEANSRRRTFFIDAGNSDSIKVSNAW